MMKKIRLLRANQAIASPEIILQRRGNTDSFDGQDIDQRNTSTD